MNVDMYPDMFVDLEHAERAEREARRRQQQDLDELDLPEVLRAQRDWFSLRDIARTTRWSLDRVVQAANTLAIAGELEVRRHYYAAHEPGHPRYRGFREEFRRLSATGTDD